MRILTPATKEHPVVQLTYPEWKRQQRIRRIKTQALALALGIIALAGLAGLLFQGCAHAPGGNGREVTPRCERVGSTTARLLTALNGGRDTDAVTVGGKTVYFRDVEDEGLRRHERCHQGQEARLGTLGYVTTWAAEYVRHGYDGSRLEVECLAAQEAGPAPRTSL